MGEKELVHEPSRAENPVGIARPLTPHEVLVLAYLQDRGGDEYAFGFATIGGDLRLERKQVRAACRGLRDRGLAHYCRALSDDDGRPAGAGYGLTRAGLQVTGLPFWEEVIWPSDGSTSDRAPDDAEPSTGRRANNESSPETSRS